MNEMTILALNGIPIPPEYRKDGRLLQAFLRGHKAGYESGKPARKFTTNCTRSLGAPTSIDLNEKRQLAAKYRIAGPAGTYSPPKRPWEKTPLELHEEEKHRAWSDAHFGLDHISDIPRVFGPPPKQPKGGNIYSFDNDDLQGEKDVLMHMERIRRKLNPFIPPSAFVR